MFTDIVNSPFSFSSSATLQLAWFCQRCNPFRSILSNAISWRKDEESFEWRNTGGRRNSRPQPNHINKSIWFECGAISVRLNTRCTYTATRFWVFWQINYALIRFVIDSTFDYARRQTAWRIAWMTDCTTNRGKTRSKSIPNVPKQWIGRRFDGERRLGDTRIRRTSTEKRHPNKTGKLTMKRKASLPFFLLGSHWYRCRMSFLVRKMVNQYRYHWWKWHIINVSQPRRSILGSNGWIRLVILFQNQRQSKRWFNVIELRQNDIRTEYFDLEFVSITLD